MNLYHLRDTCAFCGYESDGMELAGLTSNTSAVRCRDRRACLRRLWQQGVPVMLLEPSSGAHEHLRRALAKTWKQVAMEMQA